MEKYDVMAVLETGINKNNKPKKIDNHIVARINHQEIKGKEQYQHNGAGTMILTKDNLHTQNGREIFNNDK